MFTENMACPEGSFFAEQYSKCLLLGENELTWQEAVDFCQTQGGLLWYPHYDELNSAVFDFFQRMQIERGKVYLKVGIIWSFSSIVDVVS